MFKVSIQLKQNCRSSQYNITSILYKDGHTDTCTHRGTQGQNTDIQIDRLVSVYPRKTFLLWGYKNIVLICTQNTVGKEAIS